MKIVMISWVDAHFLTNGWICKTHAKESKADNCVSIGVLLKETETEIIISPNLTEDDCAQSIVIPRGCIKSIRQLKVTGFL